MTLAPERKTTGEEREFITIVQGLTIRLMFGAGEKVILDHADKERTFSERKYLR